MDHTESRRRIFFCRVLIRCMKMTARTGIWRSPHTEGQNGRVLLYLAKNIPGCWTMHTYTDISSLRFRSRRATKDPVSFPAFCLGEMEKRDDGRCPTGGRGECEHVP